MTVHRLTPPHRAASAAMIILYGTTACGASDAADEATPSSVAPSSETPPAAETPSAAAETTPIDGTWTTPKLESGDFRRTLTRQGLGSHVHAFVSHIGREVDLTLEVGGGFWTLSSRSDGGARSVADRGSYEVHGQRVLVRPNSGGENVFRWSVDGDELALALVATTEPPYEGVPAETYQAAFYTTSAFVKEGP